VTFVRQTIFVITICLVGFLPSVQAQEGPVDRLLSVLNRGDEEARLSAMIELRSLVFSFSDQDLESVARRAGALLGADPSPVVRAAAAGVLGEMKGPVVAAVLVENSRRQKETNVRKAIAYALARHSDPASRQILLTLLKDKKAEVRGAAAYSLAERRETSAAAELIAYLKKYRKDEDSFGRSNAVRVLGESGLPEAREMLLRIMSREKADIVLMGTAAALGAIASKGDSEVEQALRAASLSRNPYLAREAIQALNLISIKQ